MNNNKSVNKWKLVCYTVNGWSQIVGRPKSTTNDKYVSSTKELVTTENLLKNTTTTIRCS
jgi:antirestriction protein ArdC